MSAADICRERGWVVGDVLVSASESPGYVYEVTALGRDSMLGIWLGRFASSGEFVAAHGYEIMVPRAVFARATPGQLAAIRPPDVPDTWDCSEDIPAGTYVLGDTGEVILRVFDCDEHLVDLNSGEAWSSHGRRFRRARIGSASLLVDINRWLPRLDALAREDGDR